MGSSHSRLTRLWKSHPFRIFLTISTIILLFVSMVFVGLTSYMNFRYRFQGQDVGQTRIAIIDSGCSSQQGTFVVEYKSFISEEYDYTYGEVNQFDQIGHGEYVCQLVHDISQNSLIYSAKVASSQGEITFKGLFAAIEWAVEVIEADIINISIGTSPIFSPELNDTITQYVEENGVIFVFSSGNDGSSSTDSIGSGEWPAVLPSTIGVGAIDSGLQRPADFTSWGRNYLGTFTVEFSADGSLTVLGRRVRGTSFSAPQITGIVANYRELLISHNIEPTPQVIEAFMVNYSDGYQKKEFSERIGWGVPIDPAENPMAFENLAGVMGSIYFFGGEVDRLPRFQGENFTMSWKGVTTLPLGTDLNQKLTIHGNATAFSTINASEMKNWGFILTANISVPSNVARGTYNLTITPTSGLPLTYLFSVTGPYNSTILFDASLTPNALNFEYGALYHANLMARNNGYLTHFNREFIDSNRLQAYDVVIPVQLGSTLIGDSKIVFKNYTPLQIVEYRIFVENGGSLFILMDDTIEVNLPSINQEFSSWGFNFTHIFPEGRAFATISNLKDHPTTVDVISIEARGYSISSHSPSVQEIAPYQETVNDVFGQKIVSSNAVVIGTLGSGNFIVYSGYELITNKEFSLFEALYYSNRFFLNSIAWLVEVSSSNTA